MASTVSTEQLGVLGRRMRTVAAVTRRLGPLPLADELPRAFEQHATPAAALLAADDEVQPTRVPRAGIGPLSLLTTAAAGSTCASRGADQAPAPAPGRAEPEAATARRAR